MGCGRRIHPAWINYDLVPQVAGVIACDLSQGIPEQDASCDAVYHSAVFEHIRKEDAAPFLRECRRVLKPGGVIRVAVPDLESICANYLRQLEAAVAGEVSDRENYDWMLLEMLDQMVRETSGGEMARYLARNPIPNEEFVLSRIGEEGREILEANRGLHRRAEESSPQLALPPPATFLTRLLRRLHWELLRIVLSPYERRALQIGRFRLGGEVHQWMYDRFSLSRLLVAAGFTNPEQRTAASSRIVNWPEFHLDTLADGTVIKPDLLFMEAVKPVAD